MKINCTVTSISKCIIFHSLASLEASGSKCYDIDMIILDTSLASLEASGSKSREVVAFKLLPEV